MLWSIWETVDAYRASAMKVNLFDSRDDRSAAISSRVKPHVSAICWNDSILQGIMRCNSISGISLLIAIHPDIQWNCHFSTKRKDKKKNEPEIKLILIDQSLQFPDTEEEQMNSKTITLHFIAQLIFMALRYSNTLNGFLRARNPISSKYGIWLWISRRKPDITLGNLFCEKWNNSNPPTRRRMIIWINFFSDVSPSITVNIRDQFVVISEYWSGSAIGLCYVRASSLHLSQMQLKYTLKAYTENDCWTTPKIAITHSGLTDAQMLI